MIRAVIIDDERNSREIIVRLLKEISIEIEIINQAGSVADGYRIILKERPDLVFLDVEMLDGTGFDLLQKYKAIDFQVIFITAYDRYAIKAFKYSAVDYLLKPICIDDLEDAVLKVQKKLNDAVDNALQVATLLSNMKKENTNKKIIVNCGNRIHFITIDDILYCTADGVYTEITLKNDFTLLASKPLKHFEMTFDGTPAFFRVSRSHIININYVTSFLKDKEKAILRNDTEIEVSRRKKKSFLEVLKSSV